MFMPFASTKTLESTTAKSLRARPASSSLFLKSRPEHTRDAKVARRAIPRKAAKSLAIRPNSRRHRPAAEAHPIKGTDARRRFTDGGDYDAQQALALDQSFTARSDRFPGFWQRGLGTIMGTRR